MTTMHIQNTKIVARDITTTAEVAEVLLTCYKDPLAEVLFREKAAQDGQNYFDLEFWADVRKIIASAD